MPQQSAPARIDVSISSEPLSLDRALDVVSDAHAGAIATFIGVVRDHDGGREVTDLVYSEHPSAYAELERVAGEVAARHAVVAVSVTHRVGTLAIGDRAVVIAVSAAHRAAALEACRDLIDTLKAQVPIWKNQRFADGEATWVGLP